MGVFELIEVTGEEFVTSCVDLLVQKIKSVLNSKNSCVIGLSGGSTPKPIYSSIASNKEIDWSKVTIFLVDDRYIPSDHKDSNQKMVNEAFSSATGLSKIFPNTQLNYDECTRDYAKQLSPFVGKVDIMTFGIGPDGHFASLFPPVEDELFETTDLTVQTHTELFAVKERISTSFYFLNSQRQNECTNIFFLKGKDKQEVVDSMLESIEANGNDTNRLILKRFPAADYFLLDTTIAILCSE